MTNILYKPKLNFPSKLYVFLPQKTRRNLWVHLVAFLYTLSSKIIQLYRWLILSLVAGSLLMYQFVFSLYFSWISARIPGRMEGNTCLTGCLFVADAVITSWIVLVSSWSLTSISSTESTQEFPFNISADPGNEFSLLAGSSVGLAVFGRKIYHGGQHWLEGELTWV